MFGFSITSIAMVAMVAAPFITYATMKVKSKVDVYSAVKVERAAGIKQCNIHLEAIEQEHNKKVHQTVIDAKKAASAIKRPRTAAELRKICEASPACRNRKGYRR